MLRLIGLILLILFNARIYSLITYNTYILVLVIYLVTLVSTLFIANNPKKEHYFSNCFFYGGISFFFYTVHMLFGSAFCANLWDWMEPIGPVRCELGFSSFKSNW